MPSQILLVRMPSREDFLGFSLATFYEPQVIVIKSKVWEGYWEMWSVLGAWAPADGVLELYWIVADCTDLPSSMFDNFLLEVCYSRKIYTTKIGKCYKSRHSSSPKGWLLEILSTSPSTEVNQTSENPCLHGSHILIEKIDKRSKWIMLEVCQKGINTKKTKLGKEKECVLGVWWALQFFIKWSGKVSLRT